MSNGRFLLVFVLCAASLLQQSMAGPPPPNGPPDIGSVPAALHGKPPAEPWLPRRLDATQKARRVAADLTLMRSERMIDDRVKIIEKLTVELQQKQYDLVDQQLDAMLDQAVADPTYDLLERDLSDFTEPQQCCINKSVFVSPPQIDAWVDARPDSAWAHFSRGVVFYDLAWEARGEHFADRVSDDQWKLMYGYADQAMQEFRAALKLHPKMALAWSDLLDLEKVADVDSAQQYKDYQYGAAARPTNLLIPETFLRSLQPRWGGDYERMQHAAEEMAGHAQASPRMWDLQGMIAADQGYGAVDEHCTPCSDAAWQDSLKYYNSALGYEDRWSWLGRAGYAAIHLGRYALAYKYFERAAAYRPDNPEFLVGARLMAEVCSPHPDLQKLDNLRQTYNAVTGSDIDDLPRSTGDCVSYQAELPWGDEPLPPATGQKTYELADR